MKIVTLLYDGVMALDVAGPLDVFASVAKVSQHQGYQISYVSADNETINSSADLAIRATPLKNLGDTPIDMLIIPGADDFSAISAILARADIMQWLRTVAAQSTRICSICSGSFLLAQAGLLDQLTAACHWQGAEYMRKRYPQVTIDANSIYVKQGKIWSSAGGAAGIDLALAVVKEDFGDKVAMDIAKRLVVYAHRPGGQQQFSSLLADQYQHIGKLQTIIPWMKEHSATIQSIEQIASTWGMSLRNFHRSFVKQVGETPAQYLEKLRVERATLLLQNRQQPLKSIAQRCGFNSEQRLIKAFKRHFAITPTEYRRYHLMTDIT